MQRKPACGKTFRAALCRNMRSPPLRHTNAWCKNTSKHAQHFGQDPAASNRNARGRLAKATRKKSRCPFCLPCRSQRAAKRLAPARPRPGHMCPDSPAKICPEECMGATRGPQNRTGDMLNHASLAFRLNPPTDCSITRQTTKAAPMLAGPPRAARLTAMRSPARRLQRRRPPTAACSNPPARVKIAACLPAVRQPSETLPADPCEHPPPCACARTSRCSPSAVGGRPLARVRGKTRNVELASERGRVTEKLPGVSPEGSRRLRRPTKRCRKRSKRRSEEPRKAQTTDRWRVGNFCGALRKVAPAKQQPPKRRARQCPPPTTSPARLLAYRLRTTTANIRAGLLDDFERRATAGEVPPELLRTRGASRKSAAQPGPPKHTCSCPPPPNSHPRLSSPSVARTRARRPKNQTDDVSATASAE